MNVSKITRSLAVMICASSISWSTAQAAEPWAVQHPGVPDPSKSASTAKPAPAAPSAAPSVTSAEPASTSAMTLGKSIAVNGFHKGAPTLVLVDMGSHTTYVLQEQSKGKITKVYSASDSVGSDKTPTPPGPYWVSVKLKYPCWLPPKDIDPKQKTVKPYNVDKKIHSVSPVSV